MVAIHSFNRLKHKWRNFSNLYNMVSIIRECYIKTLTRINWEQTFIWIQSLWTAIVRRIAGEQLKGKRKACLNISWTKFIFSLQQNKTSRTVWNDAQKTSSLQSKGKKINTFFKELDMSWNYTYGFWEATISSPMGGFFMGNGTDWSELSWFWGLLKK